MWPAKWSQGFQVAVDHRRGTTSRRTPAVKIAPHYSEPVVCESTLDALAVRGPLTSKPSERKRVNGVRSPKSCDYEALRQVHSAPRQTVISIEAARTRRTPIGWRAEDFRYPR